MLTKEWFKYIRTEWTYLVLLTGSPTRVPHWARSMQWRRGRRRSSIERWSSWPRVVRSCKYENGCCFRCRRTKCVCWYSTLTDLLAGSRYIALSKKDSVIHWAVAINKTPRPGFSLSSASCVKEIGSKSNVGHWGPETWTVWVLGLGYERRFERMLAHE